MIYLCTALYCEAKPFIDFWKLKYQETKYSHIQIYKNDTHYLIITGVGPLRAAIALSYVLGTQVISSSDIIMNVGVCSSKDDSYPIGTPYLIHAIKDHISGFTYYPDLLYSSLLSEAPLETCPCVITKETSANITHPLVDMESFGIYLAGSELLGPQQMLFVKIVSDYYTEPAKLPSINSNAKNDDVLNAKVANSNLENAGATSSSKISELVSNCLTMIQDLLTFHEEALQQESVELNNEEAELFEVLSERLHLSVTMKFLLRHLLFYAKNHNKQPAVILHTFMEQHALYHTVSKIEGKKYFEQLQEQLIQN